MAIFSNSGYWSLILGGSSGMGLATAKKLAENGMNVCIVHRDRRSEIPRIEKELETIRKSGVTCLAFNRNALSGEEMNDILAQLKETMKSGEKVKVLLHSIAKGNLKKMADEVGEDPLEIKLQEEDFMLTLQTMSVSYYGWARAVLDANVFTEDAICVGLTSEGNRKAWRYYAAISAAKTSLESISRSMALELASHGVRSNIIQAGITETPSFSMIPGHETLKRNAQERNPMGRLTNPEDVANVVFLLCLPEARWINGAIIPVDGGESIA